MKKRRNSNVICSLGKEYNESRLVAIIMEDYRIRQCYTCYKYYPNCQYYFEGVDKVTEMVKAGKEELPEPCPKYENKFFREKGRNK
ncbi:MAG: hypothetical protein RBR14_06450 [Candidatus Cloacimonas acidaminovorans]|nr:hypothetical protein [Candidatus Cloacimonas acidaminovorans]